MKRESIAEQWAKKFNQPTYMKFTPKTDFTLPTNVPNKPILSRIRNFFSPPKDTVPQSPRQSQTKSTKAILLHFKALTQEDIMIGNEDQLDVVCVGGIVHDFVDA